MWQGAGMKLEILKNFRVGDPAAPHRMRAGNVVESDSIDEATPELVEKWLGLKWVKVV
jgi:hypothetical protein